MFRSSTRPAFSACLRAAAWVACCVVLVLPQESLAAGDDPALLAAVEAFLYQAVRQPGDEVAVSLLPSAVLLPACENPEPFLPQTSRRLWGRITVGVHCGTASRSVRYIQAQISVTGNYLTLTSQVAAGTVITTALLEVARGDKSQLPPNAVFAVDEALGQLARHLLSAGTILQSQHLYREPLVQASRKIVIETAGAGFSIARTGEALESGALGDRIRVRVSRQQIVNAVVTGAGRVSAEP